MNSIFIVSLFREHPVKCSMFSRWPVGSACYLSRNDTFLRTPFGGRVSGYRHLPENIVNDYKSLAITAIFFFIFRMRVLILSQHACD